MVAVVETDADDLAGARDGGDDAAVLAGDDGAGGAELGGSRFVGGRCVVEGAGVSVRVGVRVEPAEGGGGLGERVAVPRTKPSKSTRGESGKAMVTGQAAGG